MPTRTFSRHQTRHIPVIGIVGSAIANSPWFGWARCSQRPARGCCTESLRAAPRPITSAFLIMYKVQLTTGCPLVILAKAGIQEVRYVPGPWMPASAGMTGNSW